MQAAQNLPRSEVYRIAAAEKTDYRSVLKVLEGGHVRGDAGVRIRAALARRGLLELTSPQPLAMARSQGQIA